MFGLTAVILFVPMEILRYFTRRGARNHVSGILIRDLGPLNSFLYIILPVCLLLLLVFFYGVNRINRDIKIGLKIIGFVKVENIKEMDNDMKKTLMGLSDHIIKFEKNPFELTEKFFLKTAEPELFHAKYYYVETSSITKILFKKEIVDRIPDWF